MNISKFPLDILVKNRADGSQYPFELVDDFMYIWKHNGLLKGYFSPIYTIKVPAGYRTDFASIPRIAQGIFNAVNDVAPATIIHDFCYSIELFPRYICDQILLDSLKDNGIGLIRRQIIYNSVRLGGWTSWPHKTDEIYADRELYKARFSKTP
jgi:hypothetical protein